jgi:hypothetical protein
MLTLGGLHERHAVQRGIWVPTQHLIWDRGKPRKTLIELAGRRTFRMRTEFQPAVRHLNTQALTVVPNCAAALFKKTLHGFCFKKYIYFGYETNNLVRCSSNYKISCSFSSCQFEAESRLNNI